MLKPSDVKYPYPEAVIDQKLAVADRRLNHHQILQNFAFAVAAAKRMSCAMSPLFFTNYLSH